MNIKDYLKYYIGCRVLADDKDYGDFLGGALVPNEVDQIYYDIHLDEWPEGEIMPFNDDMSEDCRIKPILKRLEDMTEEDRQMVQETYFNDKFKLMPWFCDTHFLTMHKLISLGYDCFQLIDAGLAIDSKTVTTNE